MIKDRFPFDSDSFYKLSVSEEYTTWLQKQYKRYKSYINQEADRTGRFPTTHVKNLRALCREHGQKEMADGLTRDIEKYS